MHAFAHFITGALLCNALPHLAAGLQGQAFQTPFAKPRGVGVSSALVNVLWGFFNLLAGLALLTAYPLQVSWTLEFALACAGALALGCYLAVHFAKVRNQP